MEHILLIVHVFIAVALIGVVLVQRADQDGFGMGSGSGANLLSGRQTANFFTRMTAILATAFMINCLVLGILASQRHTGSLVDQIEAESGATAVIPVTEPEVAPVEPAAKDAVIDEPKSPAVEPEVAPATQEEPSVPQVPAAQ